MARINWIELAQLCCLTMAFVGATIGFWLNQESFGSIWLKLVMWGLCGCLYLSIAQMFRPIRTGGK